MYMQSYIEYMRKFSGALYEWSSFLFFIHIPYNLSFNWKTNSHESSQLSIIY